MSTNDQIKQHFSLRAQAWKQFRKNKPAYVSLWIIVFIALIALFAPLIANERPLYALYKGNHLFPAFTVKKNYTISTQDGGAEIIQIDIAQWKQLDLENVIWPPVPYSPGKSDLLNSVYKSPSDEQFFNSNGNIISMPRRFRHPLGTGSLGEDVLAGLIHGAKISLTIGLLSMTIAAIIGLTLGAIAGYYGDLKLTATRGGFWTVVLGIFAAWYYAFKLRVYELSDAMAVSGGKFILHLLLSILIFSVIVLFFYLIGKLIGKIPWLNERVNIPADSIISRLIEILISLPILLLIISVAAIARPSLVNLMIIIGLTSWTSIARFTRAEFLRIRHLEYIQSARALGFSEFRTIAKHALPNGIAPALVAIAFGIAAAILIESSLSFIGVGVPSDTVTWGSLLYAGRNNFSSWWLVIFPGFAIFITVAAYNLIGEGLRDALDPRQKQ
jgi:peptide/nickel transport system permease protein